MQISYLQIKNYKSIRELTLKDMEKAVILVGKNSVGKSTVLTAIAAALGACSVTAADFNEKGQNIEISMTLSLTQKDLNLLYNFLIFFYH